MKIQICSFSTSSKIFQKLANVGDYWKISAILSNNKNLNKQTDKQTNKQKTLSNKTPYICTKSICNVTWENLSHVTKGEAAK